MAPKQNGIGTSFHGISGRFSIVFSRVFRRGSLWGSPQAAGLIRNTETGTSGITACGRTDAIHYLWRIGKPIGAQRPIRTMTIQEIIDTIEAVCPRAYQENYDNSGVQVGDTRRMATGALLCVDVTEAVLEEAIRLGCNLVIAHHPLLFKPLKRLTGSSFIERCVQMAVRHDLVLYAAHTNADNAPQGLNAVLAERFGLTQTQPLEPLQGQLMELVTFVPSEHTEAVRQALWRAGAGRLGNYDCCSYSHSGVGTFRAGAGANPFVGTIGELHREEEERLSVILPAYRQGAVMQALRTAHPYELPAVSLIPLANEHPTAGGGIVGDLPEAMSEREMLLHIKEVFGLKVLAHSAWRERPVKRMAICGGSGAFMWKRAAQLGADLFLTGEAKYNDYFDAGEHLLLVTIGHYESEEVANELFMRIISQKFPTFATHRTTAGTNPINYL